MFRSKSRARGLAPWVMIPVLMAGCDGTDPTSPSGTSTPEGTVSAAALEGEYEITVEEADLSPEGGAEPGPWSLTLSDGDATLYGPGGRVIPLEPIELTEEGMVVPPDPECPNNDPRPGKGSYEVEFDEDTLVFTAVRDPCGDRAFTLTFYEWHRIEGS